VAWDGGRGGRYRPHMDALPVRGPAVRTLGLALPPEPMPLWRHGRPLKRWRYVGYFSPELMLCVADARIGPVPLRWWAVAEPGGALHGRTTVRRGGVVVDGSGVSVDAPEARIRLELDERGGVETASPAGGAYMWTRKQAGVPAHGWVELAGERRELCGEAFVDDSAGYHPRHTAWRWCAGMGRTADGRRVGWNLVDGVHDAPEASERTIWLDGQPDEIGPVRFADDLSRVDFAEGGGLELHEWSAREEHTNLLLVRSRYRQPFGTFSGRLPDRSELAEGHGVMEDHDVRW
jgi:hypothetical protein